MNRVERNSNLTLEILLHAESHPDSIALVLRNTTISYRHLNDLVRRVTGFLLDNEVRPGEVVGISSQSNFATILLMLGLARAGATVFSLPKAAGPGQIREMISGANVTRIVADHLPGFSTGLPVLLFTRRSLEAAPDHRTALTEATPDHPWIIISGSGTTGKPKFIPISHQTQRLRNDMSDEWLGLTRQDQVASLSHFDFTHPRNRLLETLRAGGAYLVDSQRTDIVEICRRHRLTVLHATVFHVQNLLRNVPPAASDLLPTLRALCLSASTISDNLRREIKSRLTRNLLVRYASNETGTISFAGFPEVFEKPGSVGKPLKDVKVRILGTVSDSLADGQKGTLWIGSPANFKGYLGAPEANASRFGVHGFMPGDLARLDTDGSIIFLGRADQMMIFNGINIYPAEVERVLSEHAAVEDSVCFPLSHPVHQDVPVAAVSLKPRTAATEADLIRFCQNRIGAHRPHRVFILDDIPRNDRGKVVRAALLEKIKVSPSRRSSPDCRDRA